MEQNILYTIIITMKHKTEDYKISAVKYYLNNEVSMDQSKFSPWVDRL
jgi:hypothetical protein